MMHSMEFHRHAILPHATCNQMSESSPLPVIWKELKINYADLITLLLERLEQFIDFEVYFSQYKIWTARVRFAFLLTSKLLIYLKTKCNTTHAERRKSPKANRCPAIRVGSWMCFIRTKSDRFAIEQTRQIELLLIRVLVDCLPVKISLKQNAPKQLQRFDYLFLVFFFHIVFVQKVNC